MKKLGFLLFLMSPIVFSQSLEETIYVAAESFISTKNEATLQLLNKQENTFKKQVKTKDEQLALVFLQSHKGYYLEKQSKLEDAIFTFEEAVRRFNDNHLSKFSDFDIVKSCLIPLGNLYIKTGDYTNAINTINQYIYLAEKSNNLKHQTSGAINLSILYQTIGKHETVIKLTSDFINKSNIDKNQKQKLLDINIESQIALKKISDPETIPLTLNSEKNYKIALQNKDYNKALSEFQKFKAKRFSDKGISKRTLAKFLTEEAQIHALLNNNTEAIKSLNVSIKTLIPSFDEGSLPLKNDLFAENTFIDIFDLYATLQPNENLALKYYDLSFHVSSLLKNNWTSQETKILNQTNNRIRSEKCIKILFNLYNQTKNHSFLFKALQYSEDSKVSTLKDMFQKKLQLKQFPNDSLLIKEFNLLKEQERITNLFIKEQLSAAQASKINHLSKKLSEVSLELKKIKKSISKKYPDSKSHFSLKTLQDSLSKDNAAFIEYFYGQHTIYQFIVTSTAISLNYIALSDTTKEQIIDFIHLFDDSSIINNNVNNFTTSAFNLFKLLKLDKVLEYKNIIIIPDGVLNFIPFETLLTSKTKAISFNKMPFVVKTQNIVYNSSALFYVLKRKPKKSKTLLGVFPVFENTNKKLTYSIDEAHAIEDEMTSKLLMNNNATKANFIENALNYDILHLSTHASSGDFIKPANIDFYDETLYLNELYSLSINPDLLVLSACETGVGKLFKGEGPMSIARGFQYSGAENLLFSLWQINDLSASQIMQSFYSNYRKKQSANHSNQQSKLNYLADKNINNTKKSPYYWGAFVYYGELTKPNTGHDLTNILYLVLIILIIVFLSYKLRKRYGKKASRISSGKRL
ncbi:CHAT domain-containing protein [Tamlana sp. 2201CG12-4]|uniref:CHAT domain-containing protein n=1 Tax=Tamlana sp. 2201CG12-4 TaxID=3112582 RepID=UPI002DBCEAAB|nr:CHAT domain-containing protein [Tamlana sp. 2201CG12-4]MEC3905870.1 CHAT domain-containing protein [Tamlana sp. 2201CG12-4]